MGHGVIRRANAVVTWLMWCPRGDLHTNHTPPRACAAVGDVPSARARPAPVPPPTALMGPHYDLLAMLVLALSSLTPLTCCLIRFHSCDNANYGDSGEAEVAHDLIARDFFMMAVCALGQSRSLLGLVDR